MLRDSHPAARREGPRAGGSPSRRAGSGEGSTGTASPRASGPPGPARRVRNGNAVFVIIATFLVEDGSTRRNHTFVFFNKRGRYIRPGPRRGACAGSLGETLNPKTRPSRYVGSRRDSVSLSVQSPRAACDDAFATSPPHVSQEAPPVTLDAENRAGPRGARSGQGDALPASWRG